LFASDLGFQISRREPVPVAILEELTGVRVFLWTDQRNPAMPRAVIERGDCARGRCGQFSISISNGETGLTVRFESEFEFRRFLDRGDTTEIPAPSEDVSASE